MRTPPYGESGIPSLTALNQSVTPVQPQGATRLMVSGSTTPVQQLAVKQLPQTGNEHRSSLLVSMVGLIFGLTTLGLRKKRQRRNN